MKKRILAIFMTTIMCFSLAACGGSGAGGTGGSAQSVKGETFDGGKIEVFVPEGWKAYNGPDIFGDYEEGFNPYVVNVGKGIESDAELFSKPMANINLSEEDNYLIEPDKEMYDDAQDVEDIKTTNYTWKCFTATSLGYPIAVLFTETDGRQILINLTLENGDGKVNLDDPDFLALLDGIKIK